MESGYVFNSDTQTLEHYYEEPADYDWASYSEKEISWKGLDDCKFSYYDGTEWKASWDEESKALPKMVKITYKLQGEEKEEEFVVNIPIS